MIKSIAEYTTAMAFVLIPILVAGPGVAQESVTGIDMPSFSVLTEGWHTLKPGGETRCALGDEYKFFVHPGDTNKLMVHFLCGGLCWNAQLCHPAVEDIYYKTVRTDQDPAWVKETWGQATGILDRTHPDNPLADYTMVVVPYCTGDVHLGNRDVDYALELGDGPTQEYTIHHRGLANGMAVIDWITENFRSRDHLCRRHQRRRAGRSLLRPSAGDHLSASHDQWPGQRCRRRPCQGNARRRSRPLGRSGSPGRR